MNFRVGSKTAWLSSSLVAIVIAGCGGGSSSERSAESKAADNRPSKREPGITTVPTAPDRPLASPAVVSDRSIPVDLTPDEVCRKFLESLQNADRALAEQLLTKKALLNTKRAELNLESPGSKGATFVLDAPRYATNKQELAQVDCTIVDTLDGQPVKSRLAWMLRHEPAGWRISGMILDLDSQSALDLLSFENPTDIDRIKESLTTDSAVAEKPGESGSSRK